MRERFGLDHYANLISKLCKTEVGEQIMSDGSRFYPAAVFLDDLRAALNEINLVYEIDVPLLKEIRLCSGFEAITSRQWKHPRFKLDRAITQACEIQVRLRDGTTGLA